MIRILPYYKFNCYTHYKPQVIVTKLEKLIKKRDKSKKFEIYLDTTLFENDKFKGYVDVNGFDLWKYKQGFRKTRLIIFSGDIEPEKKKTKINMNFHFSLNGWFALVAMLIVMIGGIVELTTVEYLTEENMMMVIIPFLGIVGLIGYFNYRIGKVRMLFTKILNLE